MRGRSVHFRIGPGRAARLDVHLLQPDLVRPLQQALLARLGASAGGIVELEQEHQRPVVVHDMLADLLAAKKVRPRPWLAGAQFQVLAALPIALLDDRVAARGESRIPSPPAPYRALVDADAGRRLAIRAAAAEMIEEAHALAPAALSCFASFEAGEGPSSKARSIDFGAFSMRAALSRASWASRCSRVSSRALASI